MDFFLQDPNMSIFRIIKKSDIILAASLILSCTLLSFIMRPSAEDPGGSCRVVVTKNGEFFDSCALFDERIIDTGSNRIVVEKGEVYMDDSDCKNRLCIRQGRISRPGETIICMPNRVVVEIKGGESGYDAVTR